MAMSNAIFYFLLGYDPHYLVETLMFQPTRHFMWKRILPILGPVQPSVHALLKSGALLLSHVRRVFLRLVASCAA